MADYNSDRTGSNIDLTLDKVDALAAKVQPTATGVDVTGTLVADGLTVSGTENLCATLESTHVGGNARLFFINEGNAQEFNIGYNNNGEFTLYNANTSDTPLKVFPNGEINIPNGIQTTNITPTVGGLLNVKKSGSNVLIRTIADEPNIAGLDIGTPSDPDKHRIRSVADSDDLHIVVNNLERMRFRNNRVGINTADPQQLLDVGGRGLFRSHLKVGLDTGGVGLTTNDGGGNASVTFNHTAQIPDQDGNVGRIRVNTDETTNALMDFQIGTNKTNGVSSPISSRYVILANAHIWNKSEDNATDAMRLDSSGNLLVGKTSASTYNISSGFEAQSDGLVAATRTSGAVQILNRLSTDGDIAIFRKDGATSGSISVTGSTTSYNTSSDERLKENIQDTTHNVNINNIRVREFDWIEGGEHQRFGFIAQELETVYPEAVHNPEGPEEMKSVDYSKLVPLLVKEIQTLKARIEGLEK